MPDELTFPLKCTVPGCSDTCAKLVIVGELVEFRWHAEHGRKTHRNSINAVVLFRLLESQRPGMLRGILERAA